MRNRLWSILLVAPIIASFGLRAQNSVDITLVPGQADSIEVRVRFENDFNGYFAASVFTIRWEVASGASLGPLQQEEQVQDYHDVGLSGPVHMDNGYRYQVFAGFGNSVLSDIPLTLQSGEWITLCTLPVIGSGTFAIAADDFTTGVNGGFFISLGGQESQGDIIIFPTSIFGPAAHADRLIAYPTPTSGPLIIEAMQTVGEHMEVSVLDPAGKRISSGTFSAQSSTGRFPIDLSGLPSGIYVVQMRSFGSVQRVRVVKR